MPSPLPLSASRSGLGRLVGVKDAPPLEATSAEGGTTEKKGPKQYKFRANDGEFDRYQDRLNPQGWQLDNFNANPVILYNHDSGGGFLSFNRKVLPIGKGRAYVEGGALMVDVEFDEEDPFAVEVERKLAKGILNAVSVRYLMAEGKYRENEKGGVDCDEMDLLEISVVPIPGNQRAVRQKDLGAEERAAADELVAQATEILTRFKGPGLWIPDDVRAAAKAEPQGSDSPKSQPPTSPEPAKEPEPPTFDPAAFAREVMPHFLESLKEPAR